MICVGVSKSLPAKEIKRIKVLNVTAYVALVHAVFFLYFDYYTHSLDITKLITLLLEGVFFGLIIYLQHLKQYRLARIIFTVTVFGNLFFHSNYAFRGFYGEYQYLVIPLFSLFFFDKKIIHYSLLALSIVAFYLPNQYFNIYPEEYFGYLNVLFLFVGIFLIINFFKTTNERNEKRLALQLERNEQMKKVLDSKNKELTALNKFQNHFFVNIAHEMGTPVTLIKGQITQLAKKVNSKKEQYREIDILSNQTEKLEGLLYNIRDIAKMEAKTLLLDKKKLSINQVAQRGYLEFQPLFEEKGIAFNLQLFSEDILVFADAIYLERALSNVLSNSFKYTEKGGKVSIRIEVKEHFASMVIKDTGIGVPTKNLERIFERFYQSPNQINKASGSGIGLAFVKEIIQLHGGKVKASNNSPSGLKVTLALPLAKQTTGQKTISKPVIPSSKATEVGMAKSVLIVEDNIEMREYLKAVLEGYNILEASNGQEALSLMSEQTEIEAIVTDYMMAEMDGEEFVKKLKQAGVKIPIIMITARLDVKSRLDMLRLGVDDYLNKPFMEEELLLRLRNCIKNYREANVFNKTLRPNEPTEEQNKLVDSARTLITENIDNAYFGVAQLSEELRVSERTLHRNIKKETGLSPNQMIRELKLLHVRNLVEENRYSSLQELALSVGFSNGTYLNQLYTERFGVSIQEAQY
jgi:signal transduction histidine kinase/DNA-binding response OmpR family regulator